MSQQDKNDQFHKQSGIQAQAERIKGLLTDLDNARDKLFRQWEREQDVVDMLRGSPGTGEAFRRADLCKLFERHIGDIKERVRQQYPDNQPEIQS